MIRDRDPSPAPPRAAARRLAIWGVPLIGSIALHSLLVVAIGSAFFGAIQSWDGAGSDEELLTIEAYAPHKADAAPAPSPLPPPAEPAATDDAFAQRLEDRLARASSSGVDQPSPALASGVDERISQRIGERLGERIERDLGANGATTPSGLPGASDSARAAPSVAFVGLKATAGSVVYVVDASGSLIGTLPIILEELERSIGRLDAKQRFSIVFFQRNSDLPLPPDANLRPATPAAVRDAMAWARSTVRPSGRSNPLAALERALALSPDVLFLLSTDITGSGEFEIGRDALLARLDSLNPADASGRRRTRIQCVQFLDADPLDTLRTIAERHGGSEGFRLLSRDELGLRPAIQR